MYLKINFAKGRKLAMDFNNEVWEFEKQRLGRVLAEIKRRLAEAMRSAGKNRREAVLIQKSMWDNVNPTPGGDLDDLANIWQYQTDILREGRKAILSAGQVDRLEKMLEAPYFGRMDFREDGEAGEEKMYIGISGLVEEKTGECLVYDWRAPVSSMFYDYETGRASYACPAGRIKGDILLKRQYRIWKGNIDYMFDCSLKIDDEILQETLSKSADSRMRSIVTSIQRDQNKIIRDDTHKLLVVQGPAGSGKTSIALHRIAYLLYRYRDLVLADNIVIFSPNGIFNDYISNVLPELGEENMHRTTFMEYAGKILGGSLRLMDMAEQMEYILTRKESEGYPARIKGMEYKASAGFVKVLVKYAEFLEKSKTFEDIIWKDTVIEKKDDIREFFIDGLKFLPPVKRLEKIRNRLVTKLDPLIKERVEELIPVLTESGEFLDKAEIRGRCTYIAREEFGPVRETIEKMTRLEPIECYRELFQDAGLFKRVSEGEVPEHFEGISRYTRENIDARQLAYEDAAPLLFFTGLLSGISGLGHIKHVIIDEVQDYTPIQMEVFKQLFSQCGLTMLGDLNQSINPYMNIKEYSAILDIFGGESAESINLSKSYRSTIQISGFCRQLLDGKADIEYISRDGELPQVICSDSAENLYERVVQDIGDLSAKGSKSIAVICKTAEDARKAFEKISGKIDVRLITNSDGEFHSGLPAVIIPSYLAKGLEFDAVLILCPKGGEYEDETERLLFYTCCTRALHRLNIYSRGGIPSFVKRVDSEKYRRLDI